MIPNLKPEMSELIEKIRSKTLYGGGRVPDEIIRMLVIEEDDLHCGIAAPYWLPVLEHGRGPRKTTNDHGLASKIYGWMEKHNLFRSSKPEQRKNEARYVTWYINRYGNKQFRNHVFIDVYTSERQRTVKKIEDKFSKEISKITMDIL